MHQRKNKWHPSNQGLQILKRREKKEATRRWETKLLFSPAHSEQISQQNLTLKILSGQMKHVFFGRLQPRRQPDLILLLSGFPKKLLSVAYLLCHQGWSDMELWVHESILILTSEVDLVLSQEEMWIYSRNNSPFNMLHLHIETDGSQFIDIE